jgi:hypothetical protein
VNHEHIVDEFEHAGRTIRIHIDGDCESPRTYDNMAVLAHWHRRLNLGDEEISHCTEEELRENVSNILAILPLFIYEHGGVTMRTGAYSCRFDSGQVGWGYVTKESAEVMGCVGPEWTTERLEESIRAEVSTFDDYLTGRCYGYEVVGLDGEVLESCWGFIGDMDYVKAEARSAAESSEDPAVQRMVDELASRVTYASGPCTQGEEIY